MSRVDVVVETVIHRPVAEVAAFVADPGNAPRWYANIHSVRWETEPPAAVGSRIAFVARFLGRTLSYTYEITGLEQDTHVEMRTSAGPFPMRTTYTWSPAAGGTRMTLRNDGAPRGFAGLAAPVVATAMRRAMTRDLEALRRLLES